MTDPLQACSGLGEGIHVDITGTEYKSTPSKDERNRTPTLAGKHMSASLKERLKRSGRYHYSPYAPKTSPLEGRRLQLISSSQEENTGLTASDSTKKLVGSSKDESCDRESELTANSSRTSSSLPVNEPARPGGDRETDTTSSALAQLKQTQLELKTAISLKEETLRKLNMVKLYREKNDLQELAELTAKWRKTSQHALEELLSLTQTIPRPTMSQLIQHLGIDPQLVHFNAEDESFS